MRRRWGMWAGTSLALLFACEVATGPSTSIPDLSTNGDSAIFIGAGDIARCNDGISAEYKTGAIIQRYTTAVVFTLGDNAYGDGTSANFSQCYDPAWGPFKARTRPVPGNHDYHTTGGAGYYGYFGALAHGPTGNYSYDLAGWHVVAINSEISVLTTTTWLKADLAAHPSQCILAYWHEPRWADGPHGPRSAVGPFWDALYAANAEIVVNGHNHYYERWYKKNPSGARDLARGIIQYEVGTGGAGLYTRDYAASDVLAYRKAWGVLKLTLRPGSWTSVFLDIDGTTYDQQTRTCH